MRKVNYKGRCTKRKLTKCAEVCRTFDEIQTKGAEMFQAADEIVEFRCKELRTTCICQILLRRKQMEQ